MKNKPACFYVPYICNRPFTRERQEFEDKYLVPTIKSVAEDILNFAMENKEKIDAQYKKGILNMKEHDFDFYLLTKRERGSR